MRSSSVEPCDAAGARRTATRRAVVFCAVGSSKGSSVFPDTAVALLLPTSQNTYGAGASILENQAQRQGRMVKAAPFSRPLLQTEKGLSVAACPGAGGEAEISVRSNNRVWLGGTAPLAAPLAPSARLAGSASCQRSPTCINDSASARPAIPIVVCEMVAGKAGLVEFHLCAVDHPHRVGNPQQIVAAGPLAGAAAQDSVLQAAGPGDGAGLCRIGRKVGGIGRGAQRILRRRRHGRRRQQHN